ncbi:MAG: RNA polymerase sigma factor [Verrucomicrobia bacterium]|nr:RNA polymerase sigma factor [Verrucomicrobiota bacterium]
MPPQNQDDAHWFAAEVQPHAAGLRAYLVHQYPTISDPDNLVQESLVRVVRARAQGPVEAPRALLFATARNLAVDQMRRQRVVSFEPMTEISDSSVFLGGGTIPEAVSHDEELALLTQAIQSLPDRCRQVFTLRVAYGLSQREIAARLGISENTVEKQIGKGLRRCTAFFARHGLP